MKNLKSFKLITENPDFVTASYNNDYIYVNWEHLDAISFGYVNKGSESNTSYEMICGVLGVTHSTISSRLTMKYPGRLWTKKKIISFWRSPDLTDEVGKSEFKKLIEDVQNSYNKSFIGIGTYAIQFQEAGISPYGDGKWYLSNNVVNNVSFKKSNNKYYLYVELNNELYEIIDTYYNKSHTNSSNISLSTLYEWLDNNRFEDLKKEIEEKFMIFVLKSRKKLHINDTWLVEDESGNLHPISSFIGSIERSEEEMGKAHLDWKLKDQLKKKGWGKGWGSDMTAWDGKNPLAWRQAKYQENLNNNYDTEI